MNKAEIIAKDLLAIEAIQVKTEGYFTWTSGIQSPIYCDNRLIISYPDTRKKVVDAWIDIIKEKNLQPDVIAGCATAGIPHAAWLAEALNLPMVYIRSKPKGHGTASQIEGVIQPGQKALVIEDLISTGGSAIDAAKVLANEGVEVEHVLAIFTYGIGRAKENFEAAQFPYETILNFDQLLDVLVASEKMTEADKQRLQTWRNTL